MEHFTPLLGFTHFSLDLLTQRYDPRLAQLVVFQIWFYAFAIDLKSIE